MSSIAWLWVFTALAFVIAVSAIAICLSYRRRIESIIQDALSITDLSSSKASLEMEIEQCEKSLDEKQEELRKFDGERQRHESIRKELVGLSSQVVEEEKKRDEYKKEAEDLRNTISELSQELERLKPDEPDQEVEREGEGEEGQLENEEEAKPLVKLRRVRKHKLRI